VLPSRVRLREGPKCKIKGRVGFRPTMLQYCFAHFAVGRAVHTGTAHCLQLVVEDEVFCTRCMHLQ
jgi:hypothetical protein